MVGHDELVQRVQILEAQLDGLQADVRMLVHEVIRLERHQMIGVNPDLIDREKA
jgi:cell division protein FtsB